MMREEGQGSTVARVLTGPGPGAIAVIEVRGPAALDAVERIFTPKFRRSLRDSGPDVPRVGRIGGEEGEEVVVIPLRIDPPAVEIHGHGGPAAVAALLDALRDRGVRIATNEPGTDAPPWAEVATRVLPHAPSLRVAEILLDQSSGAFDRAWDDLHDLSDRDPEEARHRARALLARASFGLRLVDGWAVALTGRPNVGKSHLLNALAGYRRAVVSPMPGTTRDLVTARTALDGWPVLLIDTAGLRETAEALEAEGIARALARVATADLAVVVLDGSEPLTDDDRGALAAHPYALRVANKADLPPAWDASELGAMRVSATTGEGLLPLEREIARRIVPEPSPPGAAVPVSTGMALALEAFLAGLPDRGG